jgi:hypothetical protein
MSTFQEHSPLIGRVGADHDRANAILESMDERYWQPVVEFGKSIAELLSPVLEDFTASAHSIAQKIATAPEIPGHERILIELIGYSPFGAKLITRVIHRWGELLAAEINEGRRVRAIMDEIAKAHGRSALVMSRRAKKFQDNCRSAEARDLIDGAGKKVGLSSTVTDFNKLAALASERDEFACRELGRMAEQLAPHLPEKRGRPISVETCTHFFLLRQLESWGINRAYTYSDIAGKTHFVDQVTQATRLATNNSRFSPLHANRLRKDKTRMSPVLRLLSANANSRHVTAL